jgi:hypothetical protein
MIIPTPEKIKPEQKELIVIRECFCPNGHNLVTSKVKFNDRDGILLTIKRKSKKGKIALSPVYGDKSRISIDVDLKEGDLVQLFCPDCKVKLSTYADCECGGELVVMFTQPAIDYKNCIGICNRVGCRHAEIKNEGQLMTLIKGD